MGKGRFEILLKSLNLLTRRDKRLLGASVVIQVGLSFLDLIGVALIGVLATLSVSGVQSRSPEGRVAQVLEILRIESFSFQSQTAVLAICASITLVGRTILSMYFSRKAMFFLSRRGARISQSLIARLLNQNILEINKRTTQESIYALTSGVTSLTLTIIGGAINLAADVALLFVMIIGLFLVDFNLAFGTLIVFALVVGLIYTKLHKRVQRLGELEAVLSISSNDKISEILASYRENVARGRRAYYAETIGLLRFKLASAQAELSFLPNISKYFVEGTVVLGTLIICAFQFSSQDATRAVGTLSVFLAAGSRIAPAVLRVQQAAFAFKSASGSLRPTLDLIDSLIGVEPIDPKVSSLDTDHINFRSEVFLTDVSFRYPNNRDMALENVSFKVAEGQTIAIVGSSGAGKTTLVDIILGILSPSDGKTTISGVTPLEAIKRWPGAISYVPQDIVISKGSILENITMGFDPDFTDLACASRALDLAHLDTYVNSLPNGIHASVGERGSTLSGGQRQRLGIARALYTKPLLLVLDEATSALDGQTEADISNSIQDLRGSVTLIIIAHRLSTIKNVDRIYYLEKGKLLAEGTFEEVRSKVPDFDKQAQLMGL